MVKYVNALLDQIGALFGLVSKRDLRIWWAGMVAGLVILLVARMAFCFPAISHPVTDNAGVLTPAEVEDIAARELDHFQRMHVQIAVLTVSSLEGDSIEDFTNGTANQWGGGQAGSDNGILVVIAINDHRSRIEAEAGSGLEARVTDSQATGLRGRRRQR